MDKNINKKLYVVQNVFYKTKNQRQGDDKSLKKSKILKVGKKYFEVEYVGIFYIETLIQNNGQYTPEYDLFLSEKEYEDELETKKISNEIRTFLNSNNKLSLAKLKEIQSIITT